MEMDKNIDAVLQSLHKELRKNCPALRTSFVNKGKKVSRKVNHYHRLVEIVKNGGDLDACYRYCKECVANYNKMIAAETGKQQPASLHIIK